MRLPKSLRARQVVRALEGAGWTVARQTGSHVILAKPSHRPVAVPDHGVVKSGTLRAIIREAGLTVQQFNRLLR